MDVVAAASFGKVIGASLAVVWMGTPLVFGLVLLMRWMGWPTFLLPLAGRALRWMIVVFLAITAFLGALLIATVFTV